MQGTKGERGISIRGPAGLPGAPGLAGLSISFGDVGPKGIHFKSTCYLNF